MDVRDRWRARQGMPMSSPMSSPLSSPLSAPDTRPPREQIHTLTTAAVFTALETRPGGLTQAEAAARLQQFGPNVIREAKGKPLYLKLLANFTHLMAILLWVGGALAFVAGMPQLGIAVWMVVVINGVFSFWQEYKAEKATEALRKLLPTYARVLRDGQEMRILAEELAPGDIMLLAEGDAISADGRLVQEAELRVDQSTLSGESHPVRKSVEPVESAGLARVELPNLIFAGTHVAAGTGRAVVFATGMETEFGQIAGMTQSMEDLLSPLQKEIQVADQDRQYFRRGGWPVVLCCFGAGGWHDLDRSIHLRHRYDRCLCAGGYAAHGDPGAGHGGAAHGQAPCAGQAAFGGRDAGLHHGHLHGQDRHADSE